MGNELQMAGSRHCIHKAQQRLADPIQKRDSIVSKL